MYVYEALAYEKEPSYEEHILLKYVWLEKYDYTKQFVNKFIIDDRDSLRLMR